MQSETDYYTVLHLKPGCSIEEVRTQYRRLAKIYHPDRNPGEEEWCAEQLTQVNRAYEILSNRDRKAAYDKEYGLHPTEARGSKARQDWPPPDSYASQADPTQASPHADTISHPSSYTTRTETRTSVRRSPQQIGVMLLCGAGAGVVVGILAMGVFAYMHPTQPHEIVLAAPAAYESATQVATSAASSGHNGELGHASPPHLVHDHRRLAKSEDASSKQSEVETLNKLGVQVPSGEFSKQQLHAIALRLERYDRMH